MSHFDNVLPLTCEAVESSPIADYLTSVTIIRDLQGKVRLVFEFPPDPDGNDSLPPNWQSEKQLLEERLAAELGPYWGAQIWRSGRRRDVAFRAMRRTIEQQRQSWPTAPHVSGRFEWYKLERQFSKSSWNRTNLEPPWPLTDASNPAIISFYSFKGGVGRTTVVAAIAILLAQAGKRTLVLDLDLEAPGAGPLMLENMSLPDDGIVDYLLEYQLLKSRPANLDPYVAEQNHPDLIGSGAPLQVMTAGQLNANFIEKLARLDFEHFINQETNPLVDFLFHANEEYDLDFILLDLRSGLHDLGGLSLNGLSHLDVLFGTETEQSWAGLELVLNFLTRSTPRREALLVHAMNPLTLFDPEGLTHQRFQNRGQNLFGSNYYDVHETIPDIEDPSAPYAFPINYNPLLININRLSRVVSIFTEPTGDYTALARTLGTFLERDTI